jgi:LuxR family maltose regulon positive regulatory protein
MMHVGSAVGSNAVAGGLARPVAGGTVSRPRLFERLSAPARVTVVSAPAGSGKTVLLRSWISYAGLTGSAAWVPVGRGEGDPQPFWLSVLAALRQTGAGSALAQPLTAAPALDGGGIVERLLADLEPLEEQVWLVVDDAHELSPDALGQLELLIMRAPPQLRFVLAVRHDVRLGLHRLRLEGGLTEVRGPDLRFTVAEAEELFADAGVQLASLSRLVDRTEGWAAGLRLAALSMAGHPEPERFAEDFSGSERTVAEYLLAEVLDRQPELVRRLLLRTSILDRVNGELAGLLTGASGGERWLQDLEAANAFVVALDAGRTWFRYHRLFGDLLRLELRRTAPDEVTALHQAAAGWFAGHEYPVEAIRHAQAAQDWDRAVALLADRWPALYLDGQTATVHALLAGFPVEKATANVELAALLGADELTQGSPEAAQRYLSLAERGSASVPEGRQVQAQLLLGIVRLLLARSRGDRSAVGEAAGRLQPAAAPEVTEATQPGLGQDLRTLALISLGSSEFWAARFEEAERHLEQGVSLARRVGRPYLEFTGLVYQASIDYFRSFALAAKHSRQAAELAERHGWADEPAAAQASLTVGGVLTWQGRLAEAEPWIQSAERTLRAETDPATELAIRSIRGMLELARGRNADALAAFQAADRTAARLAEPNHMVHGNRSFLVQTLVRLGETERAEQALAVLADQDREIGQMRISLATLRLAQDNTRGAIDALAPVLDGSAPLPWAGWLAQPFLLEAIARDALGDPRRRKRPGARARSGRTRRRAVVVRAAPGAGPAGAARPARHRPRRPGRRHPQPARRKQARLATRHAGAAARGAKRQRDPGAALPADQPDGTGDRARAVPLTQHHPDPHAPPVREARHPHAGRHRRPGPSPRPAGTLPAPRPGNAGRLRAGSRIPAADSRTSRRWKAADFEQLEPERLDLREHPVQRRAVRQRPSQDGVSAARPGLQSGECGEHRLAQAATDTDPVPVRQRLVARTRHLFTTRALARRLAAAPSSGAPCFPPGSRGPQTPASAPELWAVTA